MALPHYSEHHCSQRRTRNCGGTGISGKGQSGPNSVEPCAKKTPLTRWADSWQICLVGEKERENSLQASVPSLKKPKSLQSLSCDVQSIWGGFSVGKGVSTKRAACQRAWAGIRLSDKRNSLKKGKELGDVWREWRIIACEVHSLLGCSAGA